jgi:O-antigen/teichoic acid export membrane protein
LARIARLSARISALFALGLTLLIVLLGPLLLGMFGPGFGDAYPALLIMLAGGLISSFTGSVGHLMTMTGYQRAALIIFTGAFAVSLLLNVALIPSLGAVGSAIASSVALVAWNLAMSIFVRRKIGIDATALGKPPAGREHRSAQL